MGFLNFRKRNKNNASNRTLKCELPELTFEQSGSNDETDSGSSSASFNSPIADSFMMASSIPDLNSTSLLEDILSELPDPIKIKPPPIYNANERSTTVNISIPYSSSPEPNNDKKSTSTAIEQFSKNSIGGSTLTINNKVAVKPSKEKISTTIIFKSNDNSNQQSTFNNNNFIIKKASSLSTSEFKSMSPKNSTEKLVPLRDISRSDHRLYSTIRTTASEKTAPDMYPSVDFSAAKYNTMNPTANNLKSYGDKINTKKVENGSHTAINSYLISAQQPPSFTIDRMKERHRREYRRSLQWTPTVPEPKVTHIKRASSLMTSNNVNGNYQRDLFAQNQQQQKYFQPQVLRQHNPVIYEALPRNEQRCLIVVPMTSKSVTPLLLSDNHMTPAKSFSTSQYNRPLSAAALKSGSHNSKSFTMKPIIENASLPINKTCSASILKKAATTPPICCKNTHTVHKSNCYTAQICHTKQIVVTQAQNAYKNEKCTFDRQIKFLPRADDFCNLEYTQNLDSNKRTKVFGTLAAGLTKLDGALASYMKNSPKLKKEYRRMQQIHRKKCYSVPNLRLLLDNDKETNKIQLLRKSFEPTRPVALISKESDTKRKESNNGNSFTIKNNDVSSYTCKQHCFHENKNNYHVSSKCKQNQTARCCHQIKQTSPECCCNNSRTGHHNKRRSKVTTPSENSKFSTSLGPLKQPRHGAKCRV